MLWRKGSRHPVVAARGKMDAIEKHVREVRGTKRMVGFYPRSEKEARVFTRLARKRGYNVKVHPDGYYQFH